ncbi:helix-turn-helix domain-containing protein [Roseburia hominis]
MTIKEAAAKTGLTEKTIRYYEAQGLIHPAMEEKNGRNFRTYTEKEVRELCNIAVLRKMRFTIEEIRQLQRKQTDTGMLFTAYRRRIEQEMKEISEIYGLVSGMKPEEMQDIADLAARAEKYLKKASLPQTDLSVDFGRIDAMEYRQMTRSVRTINVRGKRSIFPTRLNIVQVRIVFYLMEKEHTFTELCHYCMAQGITRDPRAVRKAVNKMKRRKIVSEKNGVCRALIDPKNIKAADIERMVQIASTGSGDQLFIYNWNPPGGVSSMPYTGI